MNMSWDKAVRAFDAQRKQYMVTHYSAEERLSGKNREAFRMGLEARAALPMPSTELSGSSAKTGRRT